MDQSVLDEVARDLALRAAEHDRDGSFPFEGFDLLRAAGLLKLTVPVELGGDGAGLVDVSRAVGTIAQGDPSVALVFSMQCIGHAGISRLGRWPRHMYEMIARDAVENGGIINSLRVEPELGTPARGGLPTTTAVPVPGGYRLSGHKIYTTGIPVLRWLNVWGRTPEDDPLVGNFLVRSDSPGIQVIETWDHMGMRATASHDVVFKDVFVPADHAVDICHPKDRPPQDATGAAWNALIIGSLYDGVARAARNWLIWYLKDRKPTNLGASLATLPRFQSAVGEIDGMLTASRRLIESVARETDAGTPPSFAECNLVKREITNNAIQSVELGISLIGNPGLSRKNPIERHYRDVLCSRIHTPQDDVIVLGAGRAALGV